MRNARPCDLVPAHSHWATAAPRVVNIEPEAPETIDLFAQRIEGLDGNEAQARSQTDQGARWYVRQIG
jgi:hypothetical protein